MALPDAGNPFEEPAAPPDVRQATHPALQAARAAITAPRPAPQKSDQGELSMPPPASGALGTVSPSAYAQQFHPSFSDSRPQRHSKRPSLFRKSISALAGQRMSQGGSGLQRKPSALRKSMAWLLGNPPPVRLAPGMGDAPVNKESKEAGKDPFLGGGGEGSEWDVDGSGRAFWKRFSTAQRRALDERDPLTQTSKEYVGSQARKNRKLKIGIYLFLVLLIALIIGLAVGIPAAQKSNDGSESGQSGNMKRSLWPHSQADVRGDDVETVPVTLSDIPRVLNKTHKKRLHRLSIAERQPLK